MDDEKFLAFYTQVLGISECEARLHISKFEKLEFPKKKLLLQAGETENYLSFVESGIIRFFITKYDKNDLDKEYTFSFALENSFYSAYDSFISKKPCLYNIETLEKTVLYRITHEDLQNLYKESKVANYLGRLSAEQLYLKKMHREISFLIQTAKQRYIELLETNPHYLQKIPLKYLASYIGITPQALSRIRKKIF